MARETVTDRAARHRPADAQGERNRSLHHVADSVIRAQQRAAGAHTGGAVGPSAGGRNLWPAPKAASVPGTTRVRRARASRSRRYGARAPRPDAWLAQRGGGPHTTVRVRGCASALCSRVAGPFLRRGAAWQSLVLLVVGGSDQAQGHYWRHCQPSFWPVKAVEHEGQRC